MYVFALYANLRFGIPMFWREPKRHLNDCYPSLVDLKRFNKKILGILPRFRIGAVTCASLWGSTCAWIERFICHTNG